MKNKIVIKDEIFADFLIKNKDNHNISASPKVIMDRCIVEQVPESFDEVKQLLKEHIDKLKLNMDVWGIKIYEHFIDIEKKYVSYRVRFTDIGNILFDSYLLIATDKRPSEIWQIIKALIGYGEVK